MSPGSVVVLLSQPERMVVEVVSVDRLQGVPAVVVEQLRRRDDAESVVVKRRRVVGVEDLDVGVRVDRLTGSERKEDERDLLRLVGGHGHELGQRAFCKVKGNQLSNGFSLGSVAPLSLASYCFSSQALITSR